MVKRIGRFTLEKTLGKGTFSKVKLGIDKDTGEKVAVKIIDKAQLAREHMEDQLRREVAIMRHLKHEHVVALHEVLQTSKNIYLILDLVTGGELFDRIVAAKRFDEPTARRYFQQLILGIAYCHANGVAHRDLKPENLLLDGSDVLKISDFGLSNLQRAGSSAAVLQTVCGTPNYVAPEVLREKGYNGFIADVWSCGVILFVMLAGYLPFDDPNMNALFVKIERGEYRAPRHLSPPVAALIQSMMTVDVARRATLREVCAHAWFTTDMPAGFEAKLAAAFNPTGTPAAAAASAPLPDFPTVTEGVAPPPAAAAAPPALDGGVDAFDIISRLTAGTLTSLLSSAGSVKRSTQFMAHGGGADVADKLVAALTQLRASPKVKDMAAAGAEVGSGGVRVSHEVKGFLSTPRGLVTYVAEVMPTVTAGLCMVEVRRTRGDTLEFHEFFRALLAALGPSATFGGPVGGAPAP